MSEVKNVEVDPQVDVIDKEFLIKLMLSKSKNVFVKAQENSKSEIWKNFSRIYFKNVATSFICCNKCEAKCVLKQDRNTEINELDSYIAEETPHVDAVYYWSSHIKYFKLREVSFFLFSIPVSSVSSERGSTGHCINNSRHRNLYHYGDAPSMFLLLNDKSVNIDSIISNLMKKEIYALFKLNFRKSLITIWKLQVEMM
ncbi:hypothetical protein HELRODRAFT_178187 [Helobdella robusta]|uniref:Uncharacterized protein n=1 Tax=Helobdella robusta TaxID=6412 RepID=T1FCW6_HELRO|nr:hypothetical protein HELRODRAFT_178187 [Helobdella robusta]ESN97396.1 hypothetical protein HELRODRAFT_178187 [Helobdella robusta]